MRAKRLKKIRASNIRAFGQKGLHNLATLAKILGVPDERDAKLMKIGSSSINDLHGHIAKLKLAMGLTPSTMDVVWASLGDTDASLYIGFQPGLSPRNIHPQLWLQKMIAVMNRVPDETVRFVDRVFGEMLKMRNCARSDTFPMSKPEKREQKDYGALFPLQKRTLQ